jgi:glycosyltransferase involved in cell wall biosynthesis
LFRVVFQDVNNFKLANLATCPTVFDMLKKIKEVKEGDYDVVTVSSTPYYFLFYVGYLISKKLNIPYVLIPALHVGVGEDDKLREKYLKKTVVEFFKHAKRIILNTKTEGKEIESYCKENSSVIDPNKFVVIGQGVFLNKIMGGNGEAFKNKYNLKYPIVFQIGSKNNDKGSYNLINAMRKLWDKGIQCHLVFAGAKNDEFTDYIMKLKSKYKDYILNIEDISEAEKLNLYDAGDIFSMVSKTDSFGIVYLEAWSYKKPVLACDNYAIREIVSNGRDGYLLEFEDTDSITLSIEELLKDKGKAKAMGENGYKKVVEKYNWDTNIKILGDVYKDITG